MQKGFAIHAISDLVIIMGSSMRVNPACTMPYSCKLMGGKMVMINLQKTPADDDCDLVIHERIDKVFEKVMEKLEIPIPDFRRSYRLKVSYSQDRKNMMFTGVDTNGACYTLFKDLKVTGLSNSSENFPSKSKVIQPFSHSITKKN